MSILWFRKERTPPQPYRTPGDQVGLTVDEDGRFYAIRAGRPPRLISAPSGSPGEQGPVGDKGEVGDKGPDGDAGPDGNPGADGAPGTDGQPGPDGDKGPPGDKGPDGDPGDAGSPGADGQPGETGEKGATGDKGPVGDKGPTGDPGTASSAWPVGSIYISTTSANPSTTLGFGTWSSFGAGRFLLGTNSEAGVQGGSATHAHSFTQPSDHAALSHSGATVGNHAFTQPGAHTDHGAQSHSAHAGATVGNHTDVTNHVHVQNGPSAATGGLTGWAPDTSTNTSVASGYSTANPTSVGVAAMVHTVGQASAHSDHAAVSHSAHAGGAVDAHTVGQASQHAAQAHSDGAVANGSTDPLSITAFMWERTA